LKKPMPDLRRLEYFLTVARERNFTRAAEQLHIAQPALSRQVRLLEQELGVALLHRTTHEFELTDAGRFLLERGPALVASSEELWRSVGSFAAGARGELIVAYGASASYETAPVLLAGLAECLPQLVLSTEVRPTLEIMGAVKDGSIDVGLVRCAPEDAELVVRGIRLERQGVLLHRDHPLAARESVDVADLADETLLMHPREANPGHYDAVLALCAERRVRPAVRLRALSFDLGQTPVAHGDAVAIVGESSRAGLSETLRWLPLSPPIELEVSLVARRYGRSPAVDRALDTAVSLAAELGWLMPERAETSAPGDAGAV
jgi:DNA-binding transcriptional LysR family regulator